MPKLVTAAILTLLATTACCASCTYWDVNLLSDYCAGGFKVGVRPTATDGYDGQNPGDLSIVQYGVCLALYRENGPDWSGPDGFYSDFMTPIASGTSKTWDDIRLWEVNSIIDTGGKAAIGLFSLNPPPQGYWGRLVLDYVPASLNWTGPMEDRFSLRPGPSGFYPDIGLFPVPITDNPYDPTQVTRMHLTVYTPEPSSAAAVLAGLAGLGAVMRRRRRG